MKKMMMMLAAVLVASMSQAAFVQWNTGQLKAPNADGTFSASNLTGAYTATLLFYADDGGSAGALVAGVTGNTDTTVSLGAFSATTGGTVFTPGATYWVQAVVTDGVNWTMTSTMASFVEPGTGNASLNLTSGAGFDVVNGKWPSQWTAVPEPTSMALLALGVAAVGLRRRFRK